MCNAHGGHGICRDNVHTGGTRRRSVDPAVVHREMSHRDPSFVEFGRIRNGHVFFHELDVGAFLVRLRCGDVAENLVLAGGHGGHPIRPAVDWQPRLSIENP